MKLTYKQVVEILAAVHGVPAAKHAWFRSRLKHLQRVGLDGMGGDGPGRKASYHPAHLFKMAFAVELLQVGIPAPAELIYSMQQWPDLVEQLFEVRQEPSGRTSGLAFPCG